jgi:hypothetical protein
MRQAASIHFACNDPDNGLFAGKVAMATYDDMELESPGFGDFAFTEGSGFIRIHRRKFEILASKDWVGNWCWNAYRLRRPEAKRLLLTLRDNGWRCTCGPCRWYDWFNREGVFAKVEAAA